MSTSSPLYFISWTARDTQIDLFEASFGAPAICNTDLTFAFWKCHRWNDFHLAIPPVETRGAITTADLAELNWKREERRC